MLSTPPAFVLSQDQTLRKNSYFLALRLAFQSFFGSGLHPFGCSSIPRTFSLAVQFYQNLCASSSRCAQKLYYHAPQSLSRNIGLLLFGASGKPQLTAKRILLYTAIRGFSTLLTPLGKKKNPSTGVLKLCLIGPLFPGFFNMDGAIRAYHFAYFTGNTAIFVLGLYGWRSVDSQFLRPDEHIIGAFLFTESTSLAVVREYMKDRFFHCL